MIRLNNHNAQSGFLLPEVLVTIAIVGMIITPLFVLQASALRALYKTSAQTRMLFPLQNELQEQAEKIVDRQEQEITEQKESTNPPGKLTYKMHALAPTSELKDIKDLCYTQANMLLPSNDKESMVMFVYKPEQKKKA